MRLFKRSVPSIPAWRLLRSQPPAFQAYGWLQVYELHDCRRAKLDVAAFEDLCVLKQRVSDFQFPVRRLRAFPDGSARPPSVPELRSASWAVVLESGGRQVRTVSYPLVGPVKTINRAELRASLEAVRLGSSETCPDSKYVISSWLRREGAPALVPNGDLLELLWRLTSAHFFAVRKVTGHCTDDSQPAIDTSFNNRADAAAKAANRRAFAHAAWVRAARHAEILSMWKFIAAARRTYLNCRGSLPFWVPGLARRKRL